MHSHAIRASKINGAQVKTAAGENLGTIEDIVINPRTGHAEFAILSLTGPTGTTPTGTGEKLTPIPWKVLSLNTPSQPGAAGTEQYSFTASVDQNKLASAPNFDKNQWPDMSRDWNQKVYSYFGITPDFSSGGTGSGLDKSTGEKSYGTEKGAGASGLQPKSDQ